MRTFRMRWDLAVCLFLSCLISLGLFNLGKKLGVGEAIFNHTESYLEDKYGPDEVADGKVGGIAGNDIKVVETLSDVLSQTGKFTTKMTEVSYINGGSVEGGGYSWRILSFDDGSILAKVNKSGIVQEGTSITSMMTLPVGILIKEEPNHSALSMATQLHKDLNTTCYIDMDGGATKPIGNGILILAVILPRLLYVIPFALIFVLHAIGVKIGIFPRIFPNREKKGTKN